MCSGAGAVRSSQAKFRRRRIGSGVCSAGWTLIQCASNLTRRMKQGRGILYVKWGTKADAAMQRSITSARAVHPELPVHVHELPPTSRLLDKPKMFDATPFEETVFLDGDTVVLDRLDFAFDKSRDFGLACCICECPWARRFHGIEGDTIEYNTGVLFFTSKSEPVFRAWADNCARIDSPLRLPPGRPSGAHRSDQPGFAKAVSDLNYCPFVLPMNWNYRP